MKKNYLLGLVYLFLLPACSVEEITPENQNENIVKDVQNDKEDVITTPCDFNFNTIQKGDTLHIACSHDLGGADIFIPSDVVINYYGGEIMNGTLLFEKNCKIDGRLLNYNLEVEGNATLLKSTFLFEKEKWNIKEGKINDETALENKENIQKAIDDVKSLSGETFEIDKLDAYFNVTNEYYADAAISIPSDFTLKMSDNTHIRVQPNNHALYLLIKIRDVSNVNVKGGNLYGDRDQHDYTPVVMENGVYSTTHEFGLTMEIKSGVNVVIDGVRLVDAIGDGITISSLGFAYNPDFNPYKPSNGIVINDCIFDSNRRNNLSIVDGFNIVVENSTFLNAGIDTPYSKGTAPRYGIDIEAEREREENGNIIWYQKASDIIIRNNIEKGGANGAFIVCIGEDVLIENNTTEHSIGYTIGTRVKITNNTILLGDRKMTAIFGGYAQENDAIYGNEISSNTIKNHSTGIMLWNRDVKVFNNLIENCVTGVSMKNLFYDAEITNNTITAKEDYSYGITLTNANSDNVLINNNKINTTLFSIFVNEVNNNDANKNNIVTIKNNELNGRNMHIANSNGIITE